MYLALINLHLHHRPQGLLIRHRRLVVERGHLLSPLRRLKKGQTPRLESYTMIEERDPGSYVVLELYGGAED
jgi:hypothetical protein